MVLPDSIRISRVPTYSGSCYPILVFQLLDYHYLRSTFPGVFVYTYIVSMLQSHDPGVNTGLGSFPFAHHYLGNRFYFLFLRLLRCFSSPRSPPLRDDRSSTCRVAPFGYLRINARLQLPVAFRS